MDITITVSEKTEQIIREKVERLRFCRKSKDKANIADGIKTFSIIY